MTKYQAHMQRIHNQATANSIEQATRLLLEDVADFLIKTGVRADSQLIKDVKAFDKYEYNPKKHFKKTGNRAGINDL